MILNPVIVGGSSAEPEETPNLCIHLKAYVMAATASITLSGPGDIGRKLKWSGVDTTIQFEILLYKYGTYTLTKNDGKEGGITTKTIVFEKGGPTEKSTSM